MQRGGDVGGLVKTSKLRCLKVTCVKPTPFKHRLRHCKTGTAQPRHKDKLELYSRVEHAVLGFDYAGF